LLGFGRIFKASEGSASTFDLSVPVDRIDVFVSHNWSTPRLDKFGALALYFNWKMAFVATWVFAALTVPLALMGVPPMVDFNISTFSSGELVAQSVSAHTFGSVVLLLALAFGHEVGACFGCKGPVAFLDKTCIHQTDIELKREGIESLAAFLENSRAMVIIYSNTYLEKLWTVYELASMLLLHPGRKVVVIPCFLPKMVVGGFLIYSCFMLAQRAMLVPAITELFMGVPGLSRALVGVTFMVLFISCVVLLRILQDWSVDRIEIDKVVEGFSIRNAICADEADRAVVQENIVSFVRELGLVSTVEEEEDDEPSFESRALDAFDELVRTEVPPALRACFGRQGIPYQYVLLIFSSQILRWVDQVAPFIVRREPVRNAMLLTVEYFVVWVAICPLGTAALCTIGAWNAAACKTEKGRMKRRLCVVVQFLGVMIFGNGTWYWITTVSDWGRESDLWLMVFALSSLVLFVLVAAAYRPVRSQVKREGLSKVLSDAGVTSVPPSLRVPSPP